MPLIGFTVFKNKILDGTKRQTIRKMRKHPIKKGDKLFLYWHLRQKDCEKLLETICKEVITILMLYDPNWLDSRKPVWRIDATYNNGIFTMTDNQVEELALKDGFQNAKEMMEWFDKRYDLRTSVFQVIRW